MPDPDRFSIPVSVFVSVSLSQHLLTNKKKNPLSLVGQRVSCGAVEQIRTADVVVTNDVLCQLSYNSISGDRERARTVDL